MSQIKEIQNTLSQIYAKNINLFKKSYFSLYNQIVNFEKLNIENYHIDFIDNHFELIDNNNNKMYHCDPFYDAKYRTKNLNSDNTFNLLKKEINSEDYFHYENHTNAYKQIEEYITLFGKKERELNEKINKFIFIGTLLGVHINDIHNQMKYSSYLIIEPNIEIFRLSLFLTDYTELCSNSKVFFCINSNEDDFSNSIKEFLNYKYNFNTKLQFELASQNELDLVNKISIELLQNNEMNYPYSEYIISMKRGYKYLKNSHNGIINLNNLKNTLSQKQILFLGAGPSLSKNSNWIFNNKDNFIIVAASAALKRLESIDVIPDIIITIDSKKDEILKQYEVQDRFYKNSIILASVKIDPSLFKKINSENTFLMQDSLELFDGYGILTGVTVGDVGISLLLKLGVQELFLLGLDASIDKDTGNTYDSSHNSNKKIDLKSKKQGHDNNIIMVKGNFEKEVPTFIEYIRMIDSINSKLNQTNTKVYNLSNGAYFENTIPTMPNKLTISSTKPMDKYKIHNEIKSSLTLHCKKTLSQKDISYLNKEKKVLNKLLKIKYNNFEKEFIKIQSNYTNSSILQIIQKYLILISPYSYYTNNLHIQERQLSEIINYLNQIISEV